MATTLAFYAINEGRPAVGLETSKSLPTCLRVYYHLQLIEAYLEALGLKFERSFALAPDATRATVDAMFASPSRMNACSWSSPMPDAALDSCR